MDRDRTTRDSGNYPAPTSRYRTLDEPILTREVFGVALAALVLLAIPNLLALLKCWGVW